MVLGTWSREGRLYPGDYSLLGHGDLARQLRAAIERLPEGVYAGCGTQERAPLPSLLRAPPPLAHIDEGSFFVGEDKTSCRSRVGKGPRHPWRHPAEGQRHDDGQRLAALIELRDHARHVLRSQNEGWPDVHRQRHTPRAQPPLRPLRRDYGPINKTTFSTTADGNVMRRMPNLVKFRDDPDAMLVMSLEDYDEMTGKPPRPPSCTKTSWAAASPSRPCTAPRKGCWSPSTTHGAVDIPYIASLYSGSPRQIIDELGDLIYQDPESGAWQTADAYLSGNVRAKLALAERPVRPTRETWRPCAPCSPKTSCPARSTPTWARPGYRPPTSRPLPPNSSASVMLTPSISATSRKTPSGAWTPTSA